jgi:hypothetical protein
MVPRVRSSCFWPSTLNSTWNPYVCCMWISLNILHTPFFFERKRQILVPQLDSLCSRLIVPCNAHSNTQINMENSAMRDSHSKWLGHAGIKLSRVYYWRDHLQWMKHDQMWQSVESVSDEYSSNERQGRVKYTSKVEMILWIKPINGIKPQVNFYTCAHPSSSSLATYSPAE